MTFSGAPASRLDTVTTMIALRAASLVLGLLAPLLYARASTPSDLGVYFLAASYLTFLAVPAEFGMGDYVTREAAAAGGGRIGAWVNRGLRNVLLTGGVTFAGTVALSLAGATPASVPLLVGASLVLINPACRVIQAGFRAEERPLFAQVHQLLTGPATMLALIALLLMSGRTATSAWLMAGLVLAGAVPLLLYGLRARFAVEDQVRQTTLDTLAGAFPFVMLAGLGATIARVDILILSMFVGPGELASYALATRMAEVLHVPLVAMGFVLAPRIANAQAKGTLPGLGREVTRSARVATLATLPLALACMSVPGELLSFLFGEAYAGGDQALRLLAGAHLFNVVAGPVGMLLVMSGHTRDTIIALAASATLGAILALLLATRFGLTGVAFASAMAMVTCNSLLWLRVRSRLGIRPSALGV